MAVPGPAATPGCADVLLVSLGSTEGLRAADAELAASLERAGAAVTVTRARAPRAVRTLALTDLAWARAARAAAVQAIVSGAPPRAIVYSSTTAALLWPRPGAIRFDAPAAGNRPGRHGCWQRPVERRRLAQAPLLLPWSQGALAETGEAQRLRGRALVVPVPVEPSGPLVREREREFAAVTYAANPAKKGLDRVLAAWARVRGELAAGAAGAPGGGELPGRGDGARLLVAGVDAAELRRQGFELGEGVEVVGALPREEYRALVRRARVFVCAPRREDYGVAQLEALADGCMLVTTPAPGPYAALPIAATLDARLVGEDLVAGLRAALIETGADAAGDYAARAQAALAPFGRGAVDALVASQLLGRLLGQA